MATLPDDLSGLTVNGAGLDPADRAFVRQVELGLPILADLSRADVLLFERGNQPNTALVVAQASPHPVTPMFDSSLVGHQVGKKNEPAVFQVLQRGRPTRVLNDPPLRAAPTVQEVYPIRSPRGEVVGAVNVESNVLEYERMRKKSPVFRKALARITQMVIQGELRGANQLSPLGEHDGLIVVDGKGYVQYMSGIAENLYRKLGYTSSLLSARVGDLGTGNDLIQEALESGSCLEREVSDHGLVWIKKAIPILADEGSWLPGRGTGERGRPSGLLLVIQDVTEERGRDQALRIKSAMIQEIHHRVKNNLQTIAALLRMQSRRATNPEVVELLKGSVNRIMSVAVVHEFLSHDEESIINIREVCKRIVTEVTRGILDPDKDIRIALEGDDVNMPAQQATSIALVVNELLQNSVKHGFDGRDRGNIVVRLGEVGNEVTIEIEDDGVGIGDGPAPTTGGNLGMQIIKTLVGEDLRGTFELVSNHGVTAKLRLPRQIPKPRIRMSE